MGLAKSIIKDLITLNQKHLGKEYSELREFYNQDKQKFHKKFEELEAEYILFSGYTMQLTFYLNTKDIKFIKEYYYSTYSHYFQKLRYKIDDFRKQLFIQ